MDSSYSLVANTSEQCVKLVAPSLQPLALNPCDSDRTVTARAFSSTAVGVAPREMCAQLL